MTATWGRAAQLASGTTIQWSDVPKVPVVIQAVVERIGVVEEGFLIATLEPVWRQITQMLAADPNALFHLTPQQLEELVAASYERAGYDEVILTPRSGDLGRDVIAIRKGWCSVRIIDQVKAYKPGHVVTANDVRALLGVLHGDRNASKGVVTTSSTFAPRLATDPFVAPFVPYRLELVDGEALNARLLNLTSIDRGAGGV